VKLIKRRCDVVPFDKSSKILPSCMFRSWCAKRGFTYKKIGKLDGRKIGMYSITCVWFKDIHHMYHLIGSQYWRSVGYARGMEIAVFPGARIAASRRGRRQALLFHGGRVQKARKWFQRPDPWKDYDLPF
jgi:hypothetical protein